MSSKTQQKSALFPDTDFEKNLNHTFSYFALFSYPPTADELFLYHKSKMTKKEFSRLLIQLRKTGRVIEQTEDVQRSVRKGQEKFFELYRRHRMYSQEKLNIVKTYIGFLTRFHHLQFVGLSGSVASMNARQGDDIDLFIITEQSRLWTGRMIAGILAFLMGIKRMRGSTIQKDTVCLNLFFDKKELQVPVEKQTEYVAHELLQLVPLVNKNNTYETFLNQNRWVLSIFPNAQSRFPEENGSPLRPAPRATGNLGTLIEWICKYLQQQYMKPAITKERITENQLWFFPHDYETRIQNHLQ